MRALTTPILDRARRSAARRLLPRISGARGWLAEREVYRTLDRAGRDALPADELAALLKREEAIAGRPLMAGNSVRLLRDGPETYGAMFAAIEAARDHVNLETFIFAGDEIGERLAALLMKKAREGIVVNLIYDSLGTFVKGDPKLFVRLREAGIAVIEFAAPRPGRFSRINNRDHRKVLVVDGRIGFIGGVNFASTYAKGSHIRPGRKRGLRTGWRDTHVELRGPAVAELQRAFFESWRCESDEDARSADYFPTVESQGEELVRLVTSAANGIPDSAIAACYRAAVDQSRRRVWITQAYFVPHHGLLRSLIGAARAGVDVRLLLPSFCDNRFVLAASHSYYERLLAAGVRIFEHADAMLHAKTAVIDGIWSTIGSSNLDVRSLAHNSEANAVIVGRSFGERMEALFLDDLKNSKEIELDRWRRRAAWRRAWERFCLLFKYWM